MDSGGDGPSNVVEKVKYALGVADARAGRVGLGYSLGSVLLERTVLQSKGPPGCLLQFGQRILPAWLRDPHVERVHQRLPEFQ